MKLNIFILSSTDLATLAEQASIFKYHHPKIVFIPNGRKRRWLHFTEHLPIFAL